MTNVESAASQIKELLQHARRVLIVTRSPASRDGAAASLALFLSVKRFGREVQLVSPGPLSGEAKSLPGSDQFTAGLGPRGLLISLDYEPNSIAKVSYEAAGDKFNLIVTPSNGHSFTAGNVSYSQVGSEYDLVIVLDTAELSLLGDLAEAEKDHWAKIPLINIDRHPANTQYGKVNCLDHEASSTCEVTARLILAAKLPLTSEVAQLLMTGLKEGSNNFQNAGPGTFEAAADLTRIIRGARNESTEERLVNEPFRAGSVAKMGAKALS